MSEHTCPLARFLSLVDGNWRNAVFIDCCGRTGCPQAGRCPGYLFAITLEGEPLLFPADVFARLTGEAVDPSECGGHIHPSVFESMYRRRLLWLSESAGACGVRAAADHQAELPCNRCSLQHSQSPESIYSSGGERT